MRKKNVICAILILIFTAGIAVGAWQIYQTGTVFCMAIT